MNRIERQQQAGALRREINILEGQLERSEKGSRDEKRIKATLASHNRSLNYVVRGRATFPYGYSTLAQDGIIFLPFHIAQWIVSGAVLLFFWGIFLFVGYVLLSAVWDTATESLTNNQKHFIIIGICICAYALVNWHERRR